MALINRFPLTANANDVIGSITPVNNGSVTFDLVNGASFNGINQWLSFSKTLTNPFSISIWIKFNNVTSYQAPLVSDNTSNGNGTGVVYMNSPNQTVAKIAQSSAVISNDFTSANYPSTSFVLSILSFDGTNMNVYRGNLLLASVIKTFGSVETTWSIGRSGAASSYFFAGYALDARFYNNALTVNDIAKLVSLGPNTLQASSQIMSGGM
jgi:hypothetical protein